MKYEDIVIFVKYINILIHRILGTLHTQYHTIIHT